MFMKYSQGIYCNASGFGTLDELTRSTHVDSDQENWTIPDRPGWEEILVGYGGLD